MLIIKVYSKYGMLEFFLALQSSNNPVSNLTFSGPCIVINSYNKTNEMH